MYSTLICMCINRGRALRRGVHIGGWVEIRESQKDQQQWSPCKHIINEMNLNAVERAFQQNYWSGRTPSNWTRCDTYKEGVTEKPITTAIDVAASKPNVQERDL